MKATSIIAIIAAVLGFASCQSTRTPKDFPPVTWTMDVYSTEEGFFVLSKRGSDDSIAVRFNAEILRTDEPIIIKP